MKKYLITQGDNVRDEPEVLALAQPDTLEETLKLCASQIASDGGDVTTIHVWELTDVTITTKAFEILNLAGLR